MLERVSWVINPASNITGKDNLPRWFKEDMNYTVIWLTALLSLLLEKVLSVWREYYSTPHQTRAQTLIQTEFGRRNRKMWEEGSRGEVLPILLHIASVEAEEESHTVLSNCVARAFHRGRGNTEKWSLGNHLQTQLSHCLWNCSKIESVKRGSVGIKKSTLRQWIGNNKRIFPI